MHSTDEYVKISDLISATKIIALTILEWCGYQ
jgi:acetylornithine deacetylase/succinyl-diaminopimelate desuccinylase-like protein